MANREPPLANCQPQDVHDVPGPKGHQFNPEPPCCLAYQHQFLARCLQVGGSVLVAGGHRWAGGHRVWYGVLIHIRIGTGCMQASTAHAVEGLPLPV